MDTGEEKVTDPGERDRLRWQAREIWIESVIGAVILTALVLLVPGVAASALDPPGPG